MDPTVASVLVALATAFGVAIGGFFSFLGTWASNRNQRLQQEALWEHEDHKAQRDAEERRLSAEREDKVKQQQHLADIYSGAIRYLSSVIHHLSLQERRPASREETASLNDDFREAQRWLLLIIINYHDKTTKEYKSFEHDCLSFTAPDTSGAAQELREHVLRLATADPRLQP